MRLVLCCSTLLLALATGLCAAACPAVTRVGISDLGFASARGPAGFEGITIDLIKELGRRTGCTFEFLWFPRGRMFVEFEAGRLEIASGSVRTAERDALARFLPYAYTQFDLVLASRSGTDYTSLADFVARSSARLNVIRGVQYGSGIDVHLTRLAEAGRLEVVSDYETAFAKVTAGRADGTLATPTIYLSHWKTNHIGHAMTSIRLPESPQQFVGMYASHKTLSPQQIRVFADGMKTMVLDGTVQAIYARYFDEAYQRQVFKTGLAPIAAALDAP